MVDRNKKFRIAIDAMGGDYAPLEIVKGGIEAAQLPGIHVILVGKKAIIEDLVKQESPRGVQLDLEIYDAPGDIPMDEKNPARAVKRGHDASVVVANQLVAEGNADAVVAAGHTGAATASSLFTLGRIEGFERPCICTLIPTITGKMFLIDGGSNIETTPEQMVQSALIGSILAKIILKIDNPRVGLLNVGEEEGKGTDRYKQAYDLLKNYQRINFIGNVEGKTIIDSICDVAIYDGFTGNIHLKALEGGLKAMAAAVQNQIKKSGPLAMLAGLTLKSLGVFDRIKAHFHPNSFGGALLGGVNGVSIISHGSSNAEAIKNACVHARVLLEHDIIAKVTNL